MKLDDIIREIIRQNGGRITFERFMELALYHPDAGYYTQKGPSPVGKQGDFVTSVSLGPLFGRILAQEIRRYHNTLQAHEFRIVEYGAHRGGLRDQILGELPDMPYRIVEYGDPEPISFVGCVLANELLDALPVHRVHAMEGHWCEEYVEISPTGTGFQKCLGELSTTRISELLKGLPVHLMEGYTTEINLRALTWLENIASRLTEGYVLIIDYGYERAEYFSPHHAKGTLTCYRAHRRIDNPLIEPGTQDITAHVEFSSFIDKAKALGFVVETFMDQGRFLLKTGEDLIRELIEHNAGQFSALRGTLNQLTHPSMMGQAFKVLVLRKD